MATGTILLPILGAVGDSESPPVVAFEGEAPKLLFDDSADEAACWTFRMPADYVESAVLKVQYAMASASAGSVVLAAEVMAVTPDADAQDIDADDYGAANSVTDAVPTGAAGHAGAASIRLTDADGLAAGDLVKLRLRRDADNASDTATGDLELLAAALEYTRS